MKIVITQEDVKNSGIFANLTDCPLAQVMKKALNKENLIVGITTISEVSIEENSPETTKWMTSKDIGHIEPYFTPIDYVNLVSGEIKEFVTEYTPL